ncbi:MAG: LamG-like jellyroll fold domain-containing protein [Chloroflexota bacterium]|nr:LamG-like jellyroll fold domain-containing protein [Chloroflexota bacterium]
MLLPLRYLDGNSFMSRDAYGHLCTNNGTVWHLGGRSFDGIDDWITCGADCAKITGPVSLLVWFKADAWAQTMAIAGRGWALAGAGASAYCLVYYQPTNRFYWDIYDATTRSSLFATNPTSDTTECHLLAGRWDGTVQNNSQSIWMDGNRLSERQSAVTSLHDDSWEFIIGRRGSLAEYHLDGCVRVVALYSRYLSDTELSNLYLNGLLTS